MLGKLLKLILIVGSCAFVIILSANELASRGFIPKTQLQQAKLDQATWQNTLWQANQLIQKFPKPTTSATASSSAKVAQVWQQAGPQLTDLKDRGLNVANIVKKFVQTQLFTAQTSTPTSSISGISLGQTGPTPTLAPLEQRTIEYAKYLYCKETVKSYEQLNPGINQ